MDVTSKINKRRVWNKSEVAGKLSKKWKNSYVEDVMNTSQKKNCLNIKTVTSAVIYVIENLIATMDTTDIWSSVSVQKFVLKIHLMQPKY